MNFMLHAISGAAPLRARGIVDGCCHRSLAPMGHAGARGMSMRDVDSAGATAGPHLWISKCSRGAADEIHIEVEDGAEVQTTQVCAEPHACASASLG